MGMVSYGQTGYIGSSMSENAYAAYLDGEMPMSKWTKKAMLAVLEEWCDENDRVLPDEIQKLKKSELFERFFWCSSWHHTGKFAAETDFYSIDENAAEEAFPQASEEVLSQRRAAQKMREGERDALAAKQRELQHQEFARHERRSDYRKRNGFGPDTVAAMLKENPELCVVRTSKKGNRIVEWRRFPRYAPSTFNPSVSCLLADAAHRHVDYYDATE